MGTYRRINVASGRPLEKLAHYSRAVRVGDMVLQSGTTAIDRQGSVRGVGDAVRQVETIMTIAEWSMGEHLLQHVRQVGVAYAQPRQRAEHEVGMSGVHAFDIERTRILCAVRARHRGRVCVLAGCARR